MDDYIAEISNIHSNSWILVSIMCSLGCMLIKMVVQNALFSFCSYPALLYSSLAAHNLVQKSGLFVSAEKAAIVAFSAGIGMVVGIVILISAYFIICNIYQPSGPKRLDLPRSSRAAME
jgi:hypothetical protein